MAAKQNAIGLKELKSKNYQKAQTHFLKSIELDKFRNVVAELAHFNLACALSLSKAPFNKKAKDHLSSSLKHAINRKEAVLGYPGIKPTNQLIPRGFLGETKTQPSFLPEKARDFLRKVPKHLIKDPIKVLYHGPKARVPKYLRIIADQLKLVGLNIAYTQTDQTWMTKDDSKYSMYVFGNVVEFSDPLLVYAHYLKTGPSPLHTDIADAHFNELYHDAYKEDDLQRRSSLIQKITLHMEKEARMIPLSERFQAFGHNNRIKTIGDVDLTFDYDQILLK